MSSSSRIKLLLALLVIATPLWAATATTKFTVTTGTWTDLGAGPLHMTFRGVGVYAIADTTPSLTNEGFQMVSGETVNVRTPSHVWATATGAAGVDVYVAPIN